MNPWRSFLIVISCGILFACAAPQQQANAPAGAPSFPIPPAVAVADLPCAEISNSGTLTLIYATESLYRNGAVLPKTEGLACLDVLSDWLKTTAQNSWQVSVGSEAGYGFEPQVLVDKRQELLQRYFLRKGIDTTGWTWQAASEQGIQLKFTSLP